MSCEKKELLYSAVLRLIAAGKPVDGLKVSEIASEAGIGKGTVYEYFTSREELLAGAVEYGKRREYEALVRGLCAVEGFEARWQVVEEAARRLTHCGVILLRQLPELYAGGKAACFLKDEEILSEDFSRIGKIESYLVEAALEDGLIPKLPTAQYLATVMAGCIGAYLLRIPQISGAEEQNALMEDCRRLFIAALQ